MIQTYGWLNVLIQISEATRWTLSHEQWAHTKGPSTFINIFMVFITKMVTWNVNPQYFHLLHSSRYGWYFSIHNCILGSTIEKMCKLWTLKWKANKVYMVWRKHFTYSFKTCNFASIYKDLQSLCFNALNSIHLGFCCQEFPINPSI